MTATIDSASRLRFSGILASEWIKLRSLRSTVWCYAIAAVLTIGLAPLIALAFAEQGGGIPIDQATQQYFALQAATVGVGLSQLLVSVLGVLIISGEYGTGMIRATLTAVPTRLPALFAKVIVFAVVTFALGLVTTVLGLLLATPILAANGISPDLADPKLWTAIVGAAGYLMLIGLFSLAIGAILRNGAGGIAAALGLILVLPTVVSVFALITMAEWALTLSNLLPSNAGARMYAYEFEGQVGPAAIGAPLEPWQGMLVLVIWVASLLVLASVLLKRRDA